MKEAERWKPVPTQHICVENADKQIRYMQHPTAGHIYIVMQVIMNVDLFPIEPSVQSMLFVRYTRQQAARIMQTITLFIWSMWLCV